LLAPPRRAVAALLCSYINQGYRCWEKLTDGTQLIFPINIAISYIFAIMGDDIN
tara:strand:- start:1814 stop:1975 length:162 start_codon:yes stop_codon:yes gene_type:complete